MQTIAPAKLDAATLSRRLAELAGDERAVQVEFLLHLEEFDRRQAWLEAGYPSLWEFCLRVLHLREGAAARRIRAMRVLRRVPGLAGPLRDGRICLSTVGLLDPLLTEENAEELVARAAYRTKAEVEELVVSLRPRSAPRDGVRRLPERQEVAPSRSLVTPTSTETSAPTLSARPGPLGSEPAVLRSGQAESRATATAAQPSRPTVRPVAADTWSLRVTVDAAFKQELDQLTELLSHRIPGGDLAAVLREAVHCAIEKHGKRKGAVVPSLKRARKAPSAAPATSEVRPRREPVTAEVRRQVWKRDEGRCAWVGPDGHRCGSRWRVELDHIEASALGGPSTPENLRLARVAHNGLHAERTFGRAFMERFRRRWPQSGGSAAPGDSGFFAPAPE